MHALKRRREKLNEVSGVNFTSLKLLGACLDIPSKVKVKSLNFTPPVTQNEVPHWRTSLGPETAYSIPIDKLQLLENTAIGPGCDVSSPASCTTWYTLWYLRYGWGKTMLCGDYDKLQWKNHHAGFSHCPILLLPSPFHKCRLFINIIDSKHYLSQGLLPENQTYSRRQRNIVSSEPSGGEKMVLWTHSIGCTTPSAASLSLTFQDHLPPVYFGKTSLSHHIYSWVISCFALALLPSVCLHCSWL